MRSSEEVLVSVVIPTYSRNDMLSRAIDCILAQTHKLLDIIVVDDNPPESEYRASTEQLMKKYETDERIRYIQNEKNLGGSGARNVGIEAAKGEYIAFLDDDDEYYPEKIEKQLAVFLNSTSDKLALVYCDVAHVGKEGTEFQCVIRKRHRGNCLYEAIVDDCLASTSMWLVKKEHLNAVGNFTIVPCKQDSTVIIKLLEAGYEVDYVPEILCLYRNYKDGTRISFGPKKIQGEELFYELCKKCYGKFTSRQIKNIEYSFAVRLFLLYGWRKRQCPQEWQQQKNKMWKLKPLKAAVFFGKARLRQWRNKHR